MASDAVYSHASQITVNYYPTPCYNIQVITVGENQLYAGEPKVIEGILKIVNRHINDSGVCLASLTALKNITNDIGKLSTHTHIMIKHTQICKHLYS